VELFLSRRHVAGGRSAGSRNRSRRDTARSCRFEPMEPRQLLAADLSVGAVGAPYGLTGGPTGSLSGNVYASEVVANCDAHAAANRLVGVRVQLLDAAGAVLEEDLTDEQGGYRFTDLIPGQYAVRQPPPLGFVEGAALVGVGGGVALSVNQVGEILVQGGEELAGYDFCDFPEATEPIGPLARLTVPFLTLSLPPEANPDAEARLTLTLGRLDNLNGATFVQTGMMPW